MANPGKRRAAAGLILLLLVLALFTACSNGNQSAANSEAKPAQGSGTAAMAPAAKEKASGAEQIFDGKRFNDVLRIRYLDLTGKEVMGDSILIQTPDGKSMLIDGGLPGAGGQVAAYAKKLGLERIDIALNTHPHTDHIGGFAAIANLLHIGEFYMENLPYPGSQSYEKTVAAIKGKQIPIKYLERGDTIQLGSEVRIDVLNPLAGSLPRDVDPADLPEVNSHSLVLQLHYKGQSFLFNGDIYKHREQELIRTMGERLSSTAMHVPHHGSTTSSSFAFIQAVKPQAAIISNNHFKNWDLLRLYDAQKTKVYITEKHGNIMVTLDGKQMKVITEKEWLDRPEFLKNQ
ncbi:MBL fold metallo-hydrolase [Paenibacillus mesophilus]|uniref:ComEC/Rec2 family competence protein n=1 Tax=Paenibacillus mesophilus TaxID=2582849 RepID=UPI00110D2900|nr:MBL fold metallo-hydrolase [Paenibacillus mesophilus]TMV52115.1 MBL fold metallo-hydrolase [Paenibacillus mesophilus]